MLAKVCAYIIASACMFAVELLSFPVIKIFAPMMRKIRRLSPALTFVVDVVKTAAAIVLAVWLIREIGSSPSWFMFVIPGVLMYRNDIRRLRRARRGSSRVRLMMERRGLLESYDQGHDIWTERAHLAGDVLGWIIGTNLSLQSATFL